MNATLAMRKRNRFLATLCCLAFAPARAALAQPAAPENNFAVRVDGAQNAVFEDQFCLRCDDAVAGAGSEACDVGQGAFTYELWIRAAALTNANTSSRGLDVEVFAYDWIDGNIILDRDVWAGTCDGHDFGAAILDGRIAFGTGGGEFGSAFTLYGSTTVTDNQWHHVALVRESGVGLQIYIDGLLDFASTTFSGSEDLSIPDTGCTQGNSAGAAHQPDLAIGQEKHGIDGISMTGDFNELRIWASARSSQEIADTWDRVLPCDDPALVGYYRFEAGAGTIANDECQRSPNGVVDNGGPGRGEWIEDTPTLVPEPGGIAGAVVAWSSLLWLCQRRKAAISSLP